MAVPHKIQRLFININGIRLAFVDFGGVGSHALLLHGLAGRGTNWRDTALWLRQYYHVIALDQRGHGYSDQALDDYSVEAYVNDAIAFIEQQALGPVLLIGHSMGAMNTFLVAAQRPDLVRRIIVIEGLPGISAETQGQIQRFFDSWPLPFPTLAAALEYFGGYTLASAAWVEVLTEHEDGYWPQFRVEDMVRTVAGPRDFWQEWKRVQCPVLLVGGDKSYMDQEDFRAMARSNQHARYVQIAGAGHDVHLEQPELWRQVAEPFVTSGIT